MKISLIFIFLTFFLSNKALSQSYSDILVNNPVNHFQLLINNLNMFFIVKMDKITNKELKEDKKLTTKFIKASSTNDNRLLIDVMYEAPVSLISKAKCKEQLNSDYEDMLNSDGGIVSILQAISFYKMSRVEANSVLSNSYLNLTIIASENKELSVSCSK